MPESLYTAADIKRVRDQFVKQQNGIDPILNEPFPEPPVCDHDHTTQRCRAALSRNVNSFEGLVTNAHRRCLSWLTKKPLPEILRNLADYLEKDYSSNPYHVGWMKSVKTKFNKLKTAQQDQVLESLGCTKRCTNATTRKKEFENLLKSRNLGYDLILASLIERNQ